MAVEAEKFTYTDATCFSSITFWYDISRDELGNPQNVTVNIDAKRPKSLFCKDWFFIANTELMQVETITDAGLH